MHTYLIHSPESNSVLNPKLDPAGRADMGKDLVRSPSAIHVNHCICMAVIPRGQAAVVMTH